MTILFTLNVHSFVDVITNSSSELFVGRANSKEAIIELIRVAYPNYLTEYSEVRSLEELTNSELEHYLMYRYGGWAREKEFNSKDSLIEGFSFDEMYEIREIAGTRYVHMKTNFVGNYRARIDDAIDPERRMHFMFSRDDNPNWHYQEKLMDFMERYHLG